MSNQERNEKIIRKIKGLLALAENNSNEEEAQSAFLMAQKLMLKNDIAISDIDFEQKSENITKGQVTIHKKLYWWEHHLAKVMSENFRVKNYLNIRVLKGNKHRKRAVCFIGYESDVLLAKEMYLLAYEALVHYANKYIKIYYQETNMIREKQNTAIIKNSYMRGFLDGLEKKFQEQLEQIKAETNALMVLVPKEVEEQYQKVINGKTSHYHIPSINEIEAYQQGYKEGSAIDYTKSTIDTEDILENEKEEIQ